MIGFGRPYFVFVVHGAIVESGCVLDFDGDGSCRSQGYLFGRFCRQRYAYADVSGSSLYPLRTKHTPGCFAWLVSCCRVAIRAVRF